MLLTEYSVHMWSRFFLCCLDWAAPLVYSALSRTCITLLCICECLNTVNVHACVCVCNVAPVNVLLLLLFSLKHMRASVHCAATTVNWSNKFWNAGERRNERVIVIVIFVILAFTCISCSCTKCISKGISTFFFILSSFSSSFPFDLNICTQFISSFSLSPMVSDWIRIYWPIQCIMYIYTYIPIYKISVPDIYACASLSVWKIWCGDCM